MKLEKTVQGSSGSYFVKNVENEMIGVFKPKSEEPYGPQNPKWGKYIQRKLCPCAFGRSCLLNNVVSYIGFINNTLLMVYKKMILRDCF